MSEIKMTESEKRKFDSLVNGFTLIAKKIIFEPDSNIKNIWLKLSGYFKFDEGYFEHNGFEFEIAKDMRYRGENVTTRSY